LHGGAVEHIVEFLEKVLGPLPSLSVSPVPLVALVVALAIGLAITGVCFIIKTAAGTWIQVQELLERIPRFSNNERRRARSRRHFTSHVQSELQRLDNLENWQDFRFTELEAEIEAEGGRRGPLELFRDTSAEGFRRERSLSKALRRSKDRLVLVEGEPGAGKSVALRHLARKVAAAAAKRQDPDGVVPLYINLKELDVPPHAVNHQVIHDFVLQYINRVNHHDVDMFLDEEFRTGIECGSWLFLFDSFDEIPAVLSAVEPNAVVQRFADSIAEFMGGMNQCRAIVASRMFRGPKTLSWPRFRILRLSDKRQRKLIRNVDLDDRLRDQLLSFVYGSSSDIRAMLSNPMFLGLLCEHVKAGNPLPRHSHNVFESYFERRLDRDEARTTKRFGLGKAELRQAAESVAFAMTASASMGLSPTRAQLQHEMQTLALQPIPELDQHLDALEYLKLARSEAESIYGRERPFTFAHRRFQEYFATRFVVQDAKRTPPLTLLTDGRWRETAVVLLQTQSLEVAQPLLHEAEQLLSAEVSLVRDEHRAPGAYAMHVLSILQDSFAGRVGELPAQLRELGKTIIVSAAQRRTLECEKQAVEYAGIIPPEAFEDVVHSAFDSGSRLLQETAFQQLGRLVDLSERIRAHVFNLLESLALGGQLHSDRYVLQAQLARINDGRSLRRVFEFLLAMPRIDGFLHLALFTGLVIVWARAESPSGTALGLLFAIALLSLSLAIARYGRRIDKVVIGRVTCCVAYTASVGHAPGSGAGVLIVAAASFGALLWLPASLMSARYYPDRVMRVTWIFLPLLLLGKIPRLISIREVIPSVVACISLYYSVKFLINFSAAALVWTIAGAGMIALVAVHWVVRSTQYIHTRWIIHSIKSPLHSSRLNSQLATCANDKMRALLIRDVRLRRMLHIENAAAWLRELAARLDEQARGDPTAVTSQSVRSWKLSSLLSAIRRAFVSLSSHEARQGLMNYRDEVHRLREQLASAG
jgi:hypothetical protein